MKFYKKGYVYIYNPQQKDFYVEEGNTIVDSDINPRTNKQYWVYKFDDVQPAYKKWMDRKYGVLKKIIKISVEEINY